LPANWQLGGDALTTTAAPDATAARLILTVPTAVAAPTIEVGFVPLVYGSGMASLTVSLAESPGNPSCVISGAPALDTAVLKQQGNSLVTVDPPMVIRAGDLVTVRLTTDASDETCLLNDVIAQFAMPGASASAFGIAVQGAQFVVSYAVIYGP
jgi:hypothetical protein